jgi:hypothetical protein
VLDRAAIAEAVRIGQSSAAALEPFHARYRAIVDDPAITRIEVVTAFRRVVQLTEERARVGDTTWNASRAAAAVRPFEGRIDLVLQLQFSPANSYRAVPHYSRAIHQRGGNGSAVLTPIGTRSAAGYLSGQLAPPGTPILEATVTSTFDAAQVQTSSPVLVAVLLDGKEVRRVPVDLSNAR